MSREERTQAAVEKWAAKVNAKVRHAVGDVLSGPDVIPDADRRPVRVVQVVKGNL